jgi:hypothetical protein
VVPQQALAALKHGARASVALAPAMGATKREFCRRLGIRYADLDAAGKEAVTLYARASTKLTAVDRFFQSHPVVDEEGVPSPALAAYTTLLNTSSRLLAQVLAVLSQMASEDDRFDSAVQKLIAEGRKTKPAKRLTTMRDGWWLSLRASEGTGA